MKIKIRSAVRVETMKVIKYVPIVSVPAVFAGGESLMPLLIDVVPIKVSFRKILLFIPINIPVKKDLGLKASVIIFLKIEPKILKFFMTTILEIIRKNIHITGTILFKIFVISCSLFERSIISNKNTIILKMSGFTPRISFIVLVCIIRKKQEYVDTNKISIITAKKLFLSPNLV